ncbi:MAG: hypothetical protein KKA56_06695 [Gammaproteobacteria bacterium]|nr:hypothetical protein [Gammaproteobacteria bacterium]
MTEIDFYDSKRQRPVKITLWYPAQANCADAKICLAPQTKLNQAVVFSHGAMGAAKGYSWIGKLLATQGYITVGINHYGESWIYGPEHVNPAAALQFWERPVDISFVLDQLKKNVVPAAKKPASPATTFSEKTPTLLFNRIVDWEHIVAIGHSSGGATVLTMAGSELAFEGAARYCSTEAAATDKSCHYLKFQTQANTEGYNPLQRFIDRRIKRVMVMDPALGHVTTTASLRTMTVPVLVIGSTDNDFLPFERHAGYYANTIPAAKSLLFNQGEGHFVYLDRCKHAYQAMGVALCVDRPGVNRDLVHEKAGAVMLQFMTAG